jgi:hypothetical protein
MTGAAVCAIADPAAVVSPSNSAGATSPSPTASALTQAAEMSLSANLGEDLGSFFISAK